MEQIGRYQVGQRIGAGSFATVFKGRDPDLDVTVAIKVLAENWSTNPDVRSRFLAEARMLRRFQDERVISVYDIGTTQDDRPYFVMDFADAGSFEQMRRHPPASGRALRLAAEAARGIEVLHRNNVIHRDITPGNILMQHSSRGMRVMIADLGVAKSLVERQESTMTAGTPAFMAYEQATGGYLDQRVDVYSMAAVTYSMLTGHPPFPIKTLNDLLVRNWSVGVTPIADGIGAPPMLDDLMSAALSPDPRMRPASALELANAFDALADVLPGGNVATSQTDWAALGAEHPLAPAPVSYGSDPNGWGPSLVTGTSSLAGSGGWNSAHSIGQVAPRSETPQEMLDNYLGRGTYEVEQPRESHSKTYWLIVVGGVALLFITVVLFTIMFLT